jgi:hypothetical protein
MFIDHFERGIGYESLTVVKKFKNEETPTTSNLPMVMWMEDDRTLCLLKAYEDGIRTKSIIYTFPLRTNIVSNKPRLILSQNQQKGITLFYNSKKVGEERTQWFELDVKGDKYSFSIDKTFPVPENVSVLNLLMNKWGGENN